MVKGPKSVLRFSFIGYTKEDVTVGNKTQIDVQLSEDSKSLDEVVVIGYGTMRKKDLSGAVASIKSEDLMIGNPTSFYKENWLVCKLILTMVLPVRV